MMSVREQIRNGFTTPPPEKKDEFIRNIRGMKDQRDIKGFQVVMSQIAYIRKPVWIITLIVLLAGVLKLHSEEYQTITLVSALMPFVSGIAVLESFRSRIYKMNEMEGVTIFSIRGIMLARITAIGISHLILLIVMTIVVGGENGYGYMLTGAFLVIPYLLSAVISMEAERSFIGRRSSLLCIGISGIISILVFLVHSRPVIYTETFSPFWICLAAILILAEVFELRKTIRTEVYVWN